MSRKLLKSTAIVSSMTMVSRLLGFVRDMIFAQIFGAGAGTDAFFVAFKIPNFLRRLFAEGAFSQAFVPVLSDYKENQSPAELKAFIDRTAGSLSLVLITVTIIGVAAAPVLAIIFAPGFRHHGGQFELTVEMLRITFPYLFFISLTAFAGGIMNTFSRFAIPALTPIFLNLCLISTALWLSPHLPDPIVALAWGVFAAGAVQLLFQFPTLIRMKLMPRLRYGFRDPGVRRIIHLMLPAIFGVSVTQINLLFDTLIASFLTAGSVSWLYYSDRLVEFPLGIFGIALATVILPSLSKHHAADQTEQFSSSLDWGLRWVVLIGLPASLGLMLMAEPIISTLFQYNEFDQNDVIKSGESLMAYSIGLLGFFLVKVLVPGFTSRQDMKTPVRFGICAVVANMTMNLMFVFSLAHAGLALATSLAAFVNATLLLQKLLRKRIYRPERGWLKFFCRVILANITMAVVLYHGVDAAAWNGWGMFERLWHLLAWICAAGALYIVMLVYLGIRPRHLVIHER